MKASYRLGISIITIIFFFLIAFSSVLSENDSSYKPDKCEEIYNVYFDGRISLLVIDKITGQPIPGASVSVQYYCHEGDWVADKCEEVTICYALTEEGETAEDGTISFQISPVTFKTKFDDIIFRIRVSKVGYQLYDVHQYRGPRNGSSVILTIPLVDERIL